MSTRTTETTVTFRRPFTLLALEGAQPAGTYRLVTEEEQIPGLSFTAFRRMATLLHLRSRARRHAPGRARLARSAGPGPGGGGRVSAPIGGGRLSPGHSVSQPPFPFSCMGRRRVPST